MKNPLVMGVEWEWGGSKGGGIIASSWYIIAKNVHGGNKRKNKSNYYTSVEVVQLWRPF